MARSATRPLEAALAALLLAAPAPARSQEAPLVAATVDLAAEDGGASDVEAFAAKLPDQPSLVRLDLRVRPSGPEGQEDHGVTFLTRHGEEPLDCSRGFRVGAGATGLVAGFARASTHLLLAIDLGEAPNPYLTMACTPDGSGTPVFLLRGYFVVSTVPVPTAEDVLLTAVAPGL